MALDESRADAPATTTEEEAGIVIDNEQLAQDIAQLRELERSGWLALESRIRALEERPYMVPMQVGERLDVEMISMPVAEWEAMVADRDARVEGERRLVVIVREIRSDLGGLYQNLELPSAVREMLASSRGIRDQRINELEIANELRADRLAAVRRVLDDNERTRADDAPGMRAMYASLRDALSGEAS